MSAGQGRRRRGCAPHCRLFNPVEITISSTFSSGPRIQVEEIWGNQNEGEESRFGVRALVPTGGPEPSGFRTQTWGRANLVPQT